MLTQLCSPALLAQEGPPEFVRKAVRDVEKMLDSKGEISLDFEKKSFTGLSLLDQQGKMDS